MSGAPELKYTDRDVRDDPELMPLAIAYVANYTGEFDPLVDAREYLEEEGTLTTAMARKVLNCMRHDANVISRLPRPQRRELDNVVPIRRKKKQGGSKQCTDPEPHNIHRWGDDENPYLFLCEGVKWPINRGDVWSPVKIKVPYAASRTGKLIHDVMPQTDDKQVHWAIWRGPTHAYGFRSQEYGWYEADADLNIKLRCKFPSRLVNPILIKGDELDKYMEIESVLQGLRQMEMCPHCADARSEG